jgi:hypothetical protein
MNFDMPDLKGVATAEEGTLDIETGKINLKNVVIDTGNNQLIHFDSMRIDDYKVDENNKIVAVNMVTSEENLNGDINVQRIINDDEGFRVDIEIAEGEIESLQYLNAKSQNDEFAVSIYKGDINDPSSYRNEDANIDGKKINLDILDTKLDSSGKNGLNQDLLQKDTNKKRTVDLASIANRVGGFDKTFDAERFDTKLGAH